jgi:hypothetical protein
MRPGRPGPRATGALNRDAQLLKTTVPGIFA